MDTICELLSNECRIQGPKLYGMMVNDFEQLARQYINHIQEYSFEMDPRDEYVSIIEINELLQYIQMNKVETVLIEQIKRLSPKCIIYENTIQSMIDYYMECLTATV